MPCAGSKAAAKGQAGKGAKSGKKVADNKSYRSAFLWAQCTAWFKQVRNSQFPWPMRCTSLLGPPSQQLSSCTWKANDDYFIDCTA